MALMKVTGMAGVNSFSRASLMTPVWVSQRAPAGTVLAVSEGTGLASHTCQDRLVTPTPPAWLCTQRAQARGQGLAGHRNC